MDPDVICLEGYGKKTQFYARHCNTFSRIEAQQALVEDIKTGKKLGHAHENYDEVANFIRRNLPGERYAIVHGDYKFDNLVSMTLWSCSSLTLQILHPTEPRVIAILDWELSTIGHPLMDVVYHSSPFWSVTDPKSPYHPENRAAWGFPDLNVLLDRYSQVVGFDPRKDGNGRDWQVAKIFNYMRGGTISHGIQARTYRGQASSDFSHIYFDNTRRSLDTAVRLMRQLQSKDVQKACL